MPVDIVATEVVVVVPGPGVPAVMTTAFLGGYFVVLCVALVPVCFSTGVMGGWRVAGEVMRGRQGVIGVWHYIGRGVLVATEGFMLGGDASKRDRLAYCLPGGPANNFDVFEWELARVSMSI